MKIGIRYIEPTPSARHYEQLGTTYREDRIFLLHIPLQLGSQRLLKTMNRNHNLDKAVPKYEAIRNHSSTIFMCNWMVGFPGETESDFQQTLDLAARLDLHINTVIPFSLRPGTAAEDMNFHLPHAIKAARQKRLNDQLKRQKANLLKEAASALPPDVWEEVEKEFISTEKDKYQEMVD